MSSLATEVIGRVAPFGVWAVFGAHKVSFAPGAFSTLTRCGDPQDVRVDHGVSRIATERDRTLRLWEDIDGLYASMRVLNPDWHQVIEQYAQRGLPGWSVAWHWTDVRYLVNGAGQRRIVEVFGFEEISLCLRLTPRFAGTWARLQRTAA